ncbi:MAG: hypothetical protein ACI31G_03075, partial [Bacilli bacterium]
DAVYSLDGNSVTASRSENYHFVVKIDGNINNNYIYNFVFDLSSLAASSYGIQTYGVSVDLSDYTYHCFYLDGSDQPFDKTLVSVKCNSQTLYVDILLNELDDEFDTSSVRFVTYLSNGGNVITPIKVDDENPIDILNPSTFTYITTSNEILVSSFNVYDIDNDTTTYKTLGVIGESLYNRDINVEVYRNNNEALLIRLTHDFASWNKNTVIKLLLDGDDYFSSSYSSTSYSLELNPSSVKVNSFINVLSMSGVEDGLTLSAKNNVVLVNIDLNKLENIKDKDIAIGVYTTNGGVTSNITYYNDKDFIINNVASCVRVTTTNEFVYVDPTYYDSTYDNNDYIDLDITIPGSTNNGVTLGSTDVKLARNGKYLYVLFTTSDTVWNSNAACWLYFDGGAEDKTTRDEDSYSARLVAYPATVKNYFRISGNVALNNSKITVRGNDTQLYACIDLTEMDSTYDTKDIGIATCTANNSNSAVMMVNTYTNSKVVLTNPSTFLRLSKDNEIMSDLEESTGSYKESLDTTPYIDGLSEYVPASSSAQAFEVIFSRTGTVVTLRCEVEAEAWDNNQRLWVYIEGQNPYASTRTAGHTSSIRINPTGETALQYFIISSNTALATSTVTVKSNKTYCYISFDITTINASYSEGDVAIIVGSAYASNGLATSAGAWVISGNYNGLTNINTQHPVEWVHLTYDNKVGTNS